MNVVDIAIVLVLAIMVLGGWYRGFVAAVTGIAATLLAWIVALACISPVANQVKANEKLYSMMQYYTEGAEYVAVTDVELTCAPISGVSLDTLNTVIENADMPLPMGERVAHNIAVEAFSADGITTLGDYFNETIVCVVINIFAALAVFVLARLAIGFVVECVAHGRGGFPALTRLDGLVGAGVGLLHGVLLLFLLFLLVPIALTVLPRLYEFLEESFFGEFFYRANVFLSMIPGT